MKGKCTFSINHLYLEAEEPLFEQGKFGCHIRDDHYVVVRRTEKEKLKRFSERRDRSKSETAIALGMLLETHGGTVCPDENRSPLF